MLCAKKILRNYRQVSVTFFNKFAQITTELEEKQVKTCIYKTFNTEKCKITILNRSGGYVGDIIFADVNVNGEDHHLAVKIGKNDPESLKLMPIREACRREMFFYNEILPSFYELQKNVVREPFEAVPKCYKTFIEDGREIIILENLKKRGYKMHKGSGPLDVGHLKIGLKNFAKFHALSFALRDQKLDIFERLTKNSKHIYRSSVPAMKEIYAANIQKVLKELNEAGKPDLSKKYEKFMEKGAGNMFLELYDAEPEERVVTHCDCHNYNFFFKYDNPYLRDTPTQMMIVDFQISCLHSPVLDLSYFWYTGASVDELPHFPDLMGYYYNEFSTHLEILGSDPKKLFPISKLWEHWDKYSKFGFMMSSLFMEPILFEKEATALEEEYRGQVVDKDLLKKAYIERLKAIMHHYFTY